MTGRGYIGEPDRGPWAPPEMGDNAECIQLIEDTVPAE